MGSPSSSGYSGGGTLDGEIKVTFGGLEAGSDAIKASAAKIKSELHDLETSLAQLTNNWEGQARDLYRQHQDKWNQAASDLQSVLASIATALHVASQDYRDGERNNANRWT